MFLFIFCRWYLWFADNQPIYKYATKWDDDDEGERAVDKRDLSQFLFVDAHMNMHEHITNRFPRLSRSPDKNSW